MTAYSDMLIIMIAGTGTSAGAMSVLSTVAPTSALLADLATQWGAASVSALPLLDPAEITLPPAQIEVLGDRSSDQGYQFTVPVVSGAEWLLACRTPIYTTDSDTDAIRVVARLEPAGTSVTVQSDGANIAVDDYVWIGRERMRVTAHTATTLTVTRGRMGTVASRHPWTAPGLVVMSREPQPHGQPVYMYRGDPTATALSGLTLIHTGTVLRVNDDQTGYAIVDVGSTWARLGRAQWAPPQALPASGARNTVIHAPDVPSWTLGGVKVDEDLFGASQWTYALAWHGDDWGMFPLSSAGTTTEGGRAYRYYTPSAMVAAGRGLVAWPQDRWADIWPDGGTDCDDVRYAVYASAPGLDEIVSTLLSDTAGPSGCTIGLPSGSVGDLSALSRALGADPVHTIPGTQGGVVLPWKDGAIIDHVAALCRAVGCALVVRRDATLHVHDWGATLATTALTAIGVEDLADPPAAPRYDRVSDLDTGLVQVVIRAETAAVQLTETLVSDLATQVHGAGVAIEIDAGLLWPYVPQLRERWISLLWAWERARPMLALDVLYRSLEVGDVVSVDLPALPDEEGNRGTAAVDGVVLAVSETLSDRTLGLAIALVGYGRASGRGGVWDPTATVAGTEASGSTVIGIQAAAWSDADYTTWGGYEGAELVLCDQYLTPQSATTFTLVSVATDELTIAAPGLPVGAVAGDVLILAAWDDQPSGIQSGPGAWLAGSDGALGTGSDAGQLYSD